MKLLQLILVGCCNLLSILYSQTETVTKNADSGGGSLRQAINAGSDGSNTINIQTIYRFLEIVSFPLEAISP